MELQTFRQGMLELFFPLLASRVLVALFLATETCQLRDPKTTALVPYVLSCSLMGRHGSRISTGGTSAKSSDDLRWLPALRGLIRFSVKGPAGHRRHCYGTTCA